MNVYNRVYVRFRDGFHPVSDVPGRRVGAVDSAVRELGPASAAPAFVSFRLPEQAAIGAALVQRVGGVGARPTDYQHLVIVADPPPGVELDAEQMFRAVYGDAVAQAVESLVRAAAAVDSREGAALARRHWVTVDRLTLRPAPAPHKATGQAARAPGRRAVWAMAAALALVSVAATVALWPASPADRAHASGGPAHRSTGAHPAMTLPSARELQRTATSEARRARAPMAPTCPVVVRERLRRCVLQRVDVEALWRIWGELDGTQRDRTYLPEFVVRAAKAALVVRVRRYAQAHLEAAVRSLCADRPTVARIVSEAACDPTLRAVLTTVLR